MGNSDSARNRVCRNLSQGSWKLAWEGFSGTFQKREERWLTTASRESSFGHQPRDELRSYMHMLNVRTVDPKTPRPVLTRAEILWEVKTASLVRSTPEMPVNERVR